MPEEVRLGGSSTMTVRDVAVYLNVDEKTVYRLAKRGELPGFKVAGTSRLKKAQERGHRPLDRAAQGWSALRP